MKTTKFLSKGSVVRIISTARKVSPTEVEPAIKVLKSWGLEVQLGRNLYAEHNQFAGTDDQRLQDLHSALDDPTVEMIWCARGGYGTVRLLDRIDWTSFLRKPKLVVGYSDVTILLNHISEVLHVECLHATMPINIKNLLTAEDQQSITSLKQYIFGVESQHKLLQHPFTRKGDFTGRVIGGNLSMIYSFLGSNTQVDPKGKVLLIEDLDEYLYHIDRMMMNLRRNELFDGLAGVLVGGLTDMNDNTIPFGESAEQIVRRHFEDYDYPVYFGVQIGHCSPNLAIPIGGTVEVRNNTLIVPR